MVEVAKLAELPPGGRKLIYVGSEAVALFNVNGALHAIADRCSHARGPLSEGEIEGDTVVCPWHDARFALATGVPLDPPASVPVAVYPLEVRGDAIFLGPVRIARATGADGDDGKPGTGVIEGKGTTARPRPTADQLAPQ
jgi:nitrite reductase/ring-hydroxylating ferredoxin subunit